MKQINPLRDSYISISNHCIIMHIFLSSIPLRFSFSRSFDETDVFQIFLKDVLNVRKTEQKYHPKADLLYENILWSMVFVSPVKEETTNLHFPLCTLILLNLCDVQQTLNSVSGTCFIKNKWYCGKMQTNWPNLYN